VIWPNESHADLSEDGYCAAHDGGPSEYYRWNTRSAFPRLWRVRGTTPVRSAGVVPSRGYAYAAQRDRKKRTLEPGTRLRLDATQQQRFPGDDYDDVTWRFCVLDGVCAGTCWEMSDAMPFPYDEWPIIAPVKPWPASGAD